jgi:hypothetical protein
MRRGAWLRLPLRDFRTRCALHRVQKLTDAVEQMVKHIIRDYLELRKYQALGMNAQANRMCMGLLLGLYKFEDESTSKFKDWAPDAPGIFAEEVVGVWKAGSLSRADIKALRTFIEDELFGWGARLV